MKKTRSFWIERMKGDREKAMAVLDHSMAISTELGMKPLTVLRPKMIAEYVSIPPCLRYDLKHGNDYIMPDMWET